MGHGDCPDVHFEDTVKGSDWGCDQEVARMFAHCAPKAVRELANWCVPWTRVTKGPRQVVVNAEKVTIEEAVLLLKDAALRKKTKKKTTSKSKSKARR